MSKVKTTSEAELRRLVGEGKNFREISELLGIPHSRLLATACALGIKSPYRTVRRGRSADEYLQSLEAGMSLGEIAKEVGLSRQAIYIALHRAGYPTCAAQVLKRQGSGRLAAAMGIAPGAMV